MVLTFGAFIAFFDRAIVNDGGVNGSAWTVWFSAVQMKFIQTGRMYNYGMAMGLGVVALALIWWIVLT